MIEHINFDKLDNLESIAKKYVVSEKLDAFLERHNLPPTKSAQQE